MHIYADDTRLYIYFKMKVPSSQLETLMILQSCVFEIKSWMAYNKLKFNDDKSEFLVACAPWSLDEIRVETVTVGTSLVKATVSPRNLGVHIDHALKMGVHIQKQLANIADIRRYLKKQAAEKLIHAFVGSRLAYCNSLLVGIPETSLAKLQRVQNIAARILTGTRKYDHMTPVLYKLHWLPLKYRIQYKIILMTYWALNGLAPNYLQDLLQVHQPARSLRSSGDLKLVVPRTRLRSYGDRALSVKAVMEFTPPAYENNVIDVHI